MNNVKTNPDRQELIVAVKEFDYSEVNESGVVTAFYVPSGSVIVSGHLVPDGNYDATTATMSLGNADTPDLYLAATDVKAAAETVITTTGAEISSDVESNILATFAITGTPTVGKIRVALQYYMVGRSGFSHGDVIQTP